MAIRQFFYFGVVGIVGLFVDVFILYLLNPIFGPYISRVCSFIAAVFVTWLLNRTFTFKDRYSNFSILKEFFAYLSLMIVGGVANYACFVFLILYSKYVRDNMFIGVAAGSVVGMILNFTTSRFFLYKKKSV